MLNGKTPALRVACLADQYPRREETFVWREVAAPGSVACLASDRDLSRRECQRHVRDTLLPRLRTGRIVVEARELKAPTLLLPPGAAVHVRLHCPNALVEVGNGWPVHWGDSRGRSRSASGRTSGSRRERWPNSVVCQAEPSGPRRPA